MEKKQYFFGLDILRILCTIAVLIYHINPSLLPNGYLAVCAFFVLYGFLFIYTKNDNEPFKLFDYWVKRAIRLYLPLVIVTCITIYFMRILPDYLWLNLKPETVSVLQNRNNWWQIYAGMDYFARATNSPFTHMWYISLLLEVEIFLSIAYFFYQKIHKKISSKTILILGGLLILLGIFLTPYKLHLGAIPMRIYYGTDTRFYSILMGLLLGYWLKNHPQPFRYHQRQNLILLYSASLLLFLFFLHGVKESDHFAMDFLLASLWTVWLIWLSATPIFPHPEETITPYISSITYEIYLIHYPILFFFQQLRFPYWQVYLVLVIGGAIILHSAITIPWKEFKKPSEKFLGKAILLFGLSIYTLWGGWDIVKAQDYTEEMQELEQQLAENAELQAKLQEDYYQRQQEQESILSDPDAIIEESNANELHVSGIGDSVMLGAVGALHQTFPNGDFDAAVNRSHYPVPGILTKKLNEGTLGNPVVIGIGGNGHMNEEFMDQIIELCGDRTVYWLTITNDWQVNNNDLIRYEAEKHDNVYVLDWETYSEDKGYFYADGIHLNPDGQKDYAEFWLDSIAKNYYLQQKELENQTRIMGIGDGFLLGAIESMQAQEENTFILAKETLDFDEVFNQIEELKNTDSLPLRIFINVGSHDTISTNNIKKLLSLLKEQEVYWVEMPTRKNNQTNENFEALLPDYSNVHVLSLIDWKQEHQEYFAPDQIHLTKEGGQAFSQEILDWINSDQSTSE